MAQQIINLGTNPNDGSGDTIRDGGDKINDNFTELYTRVGDLEGSQVTADAILRASYTETTNGGSNQRINFSSEFVTNYSLVLIDYGGNGVEIVEGSEDATGFNINSLSVFDFGYIAGIEV